MAAKRYVTNCQEVDRQSLFLRKRSTRCPIGFVKAGTGFTVSVLVRWPLGGPVVSSCKRRVKTGTVEAPGENRYGRSAG